MRSANETLRDAVCTLITPIVIKINKNSLPLILATLLSNEENNKLLLLEQILILLKIARQSKMLLIDDDPNIRLEPKCQAALS